MCTIKHKLEELNKLIEQSEEEIERAKDTFEEGARPKEIPNLFNRYYRTVTQSNEE